MFGEDENVVTTRAKKTNMGHDEQIPHVEHKVKHTWHSCKLLLNYFDIYAFLALSQTLNYIIIIIVHYIIINIPH